MVKRFIKMNSQVHSCLLCHQILFASITVLSGQAMQNQSSFPVNQTLSVPRIVV